MLVGLPPLTWAQDASIPGEVAAAHPTLEHISVDWLLDGDANGDGRVSVRFRVEGSSAWRAGLDLVHVPAGSHEGFSWAHRHSGSLFGLSPDTRYEIELTLSDPDGGDASRVIMAKTRAVPTVATDARLIQVTPSDAPHIISAAEPGDVIVLAPGTYESIYIRQSGEPERPIVIRGSDAASVVVEGEVRMDGQSHVWIESLSVRGQIKFNNAEGIVIRGCRIDAVGPTGDGIVSFGSGSTDGYFADNIIIGPNRWAEESLGVNGDNKGDGIVLTGPGNVIEHNLIRGFRDCISILEGDAAHNQISIDILNNDLDVCVDDGIEADFAMGNVRVMRNRLTNAFIGLSSQPSLGGPTWFIRNVMFNILFQAFKPQRGSVGDRWIHNTFVKSGDALSVYTTTPWSHAYFRNNLMIGGVGGTEYNGYSNGSGEVLAIATLDTATSDFDYDGYGSIGTGRFSGRFGATRFDSIEALRSMTSEQHAVAVDLSAFAADIAFPEDGFPAKVAPDLRLKAGNAVDSGEALGVLNESFEGQAPDLGAYELGQPLPEYGPRSGTRVCGNGVLESGEECDDGNTIWGDGCDATCMNEGVGEVESPDAGQGGETDAESADIRALFPDARDSDASSSDNDAGGATQRISGGCGCTVGSSAPGGGLIVAAIFMLVCRLRRIWA